MSSSSKITLRSSDGETIMVEKSVAMMSGMLKNKIENIDYKGEVIDCKYEGKLLSKIMEYCEIHANEDVSDEELKAFDVNFVESERHLLSCLCLASSPYQQLDIKGLLSLTTEAMLSEVRASAAKRPAYGPAYEREIRGKRAKKFGKTSTKRVSGIDCLVQSNQDVIKYTPYNGVFMYFPPFIVAAAGEIPEHMKLKNENALTFSFPSVAIAFAKTEYGLKIEDESFRESRKHYKEAHKRALSVKPTSLGSSSSVMKPRTSDMSSSPTIEVCLDPLDPTNSGELFLHTHMYSKICVVAQRRYRSNTDGMFPGSFAW